MILLLSFLVLIHEAGHFFAAKALGIKVSKFGFGLPFGPTLWSKQVGDVELVVHAFLLGGYVSFPDDEKDSDLPEDSKDRFVNHSVLHRMIVISAGVIANVIVAFVFVLLTAFVWGKLPSGQSQVFIGNISAPKEASVWNSGMQKGDRVLKINGSDINSSYALTLYAKSSKKYDGKVDESFVNEKLEALEKLNPTVNNEEVITEYYGTNQVSNNTGQLLPVISIIGDISEINPSPYDRYLVGSDGIGYHVYEYVIDAEGSHRWIVKPFEYRYGVRVIERGLKNYVYVNGILKTYDDIDCGTF